ncbi:T9SS type A sorting domain-containing protein [Algibacter sp. 2305UL17-15]|uniref:T9SS type A sorting domain-containing protein n=1 Tax=Algibacter sp. 2305UL17-15 TaxID=3231268 RepID=UPI00345826BF
MNKFLLYFVILFFSITPFIGFSQIDIQPANDITIECEGDVDSWLASNGFAVASSTCEPLVWTNDFSGFNFSCFETAQVTFTVINPCGDTATTTGTVSIMDTTSPFIEVSARDMTVTCDGAGNTGELNTWLASNGGAFSTDNCSGISWSNDFEGLSSDCNETISTRVTFVATDDCANNAHTFATFTIEAATICPTSHIVLSSQADVDAFSTNYSGCSEILSGLTISGSDITDLSPLSVITSVIGPLFNGLTIKDNPLLTNLNGLENISVMQFGNLVIENNALLTNILGLSGLSGEVGDSIIIKDNPLLESLQGLNNVTNPLADDFIIDNNDALSSLNGLESLTWADDVFIKNNDGLIDFNGLTAFESSGDFYVENNSSLESFDGLNSIDKVYSLSIDNNALLQDVTALNDTNIVNKVFIINNTSLSTCNINPVCYFLSQWDSVNNPNAIMVENNASGCIDIAEVESVCETLIPENDNCEGADELILGEPLIASNRFSTISTYVPSCNIDSQFRADIWFSFNTGALSMIDILVNGGYSLQLWEGTCGSLTQVAGACGANAVNGISVTANTNYFVQVWFDNSGSLVSKVSNKKSAKIAGNFEIVIKDSLLLTTEDGLDLEFSMYPNPVKEELIIKNTQNLTIENILVYSSLGKKIIETNNTNINFSEISSGMYFVKIKTDRGQITKQVIKK